LCKIDSLTDERDRLRENLEAQSRAWSEFQNYGLAEDDEADEGAELGAKPPAVSSVREAVTRAQDQFSETLHFLDFAVKLAEESPFQSPELVYGLFEALDDLMSMSRQDGGIGSSWRDALTKRGFDYKPDISNFAKGHRFVGDYEFLYDGVKRLFVEHITFGKGQDPQRCLSVHWWRDDKKKILVIGRCGTHGVNTKT
jgi:hypothetical protein